MAGLVDPHSFLHENLPFFFWSAFGILLLGPLIGLWLNVEAVAMILAEGSLQGHPRRHRAQPWIERGLKLIGALLLADWRLTLLPLGGASPWTVAGVAGVLVVAGLVFGRRLLRWHSRAEGELRAELRAVSSPAGAAGVSLPVLAQPTGWNLEIAEVTLPFQSSLAGQRIRDTALRRETGASILTLDRQGYTWINPGPEERLYPGDRLLLLGSPEQLPLAEQRLTSGVNTAENRTPMADLTSQTVRVPAGCPRAGVPLANLPGLRALGVLICGIQRGGVRRVLPGGGDHFEAGDPLLVVGTPDQILAFQAWLDGIETPAR